MRDLMVSLQQWPIMCQKRCGKIKVARQTIYSVIVRKFDCSLVNKDALGIFEWDKKRKFLIFF